MFKFHVIMLLGTVWLLQNCIAVTSNPQLLFPPGRQFVAYMTLHMSSDDCPLHLIFKVRDITLTNTDSSQRVSWTECRNSEEVNMTARGTPSRFLQSVLQNGVGRYVCQLKRMSLIFSKKGQGSLGVRYGFIICADHV